MVKEERLLNALFGNEPQSKALKFSLNLDDVTVDVAINKNKKTEGKICGCSKECRCEMKLNDYNPSYNWNAWRDEELMRIAKLNEVE